MRSKHQTDQVIDAFDRDVAENAGYWYTTNAKLSSLLANRRLTDATLALVDFTGKQVIDIGCGDGTYTIELFDLGRPATIHGIDPATNAIEVARAKVKELAITFSVENAYVLPFQDNSFDIAFLRGVLHHMDEPIDALREALRVARVLVVVEPNGYNPILKVIERVSLYHLEHGEKSYLPARLDSWVRLLDGKITGRLWAGLVPMFCPDWFARLMKTIEPLVETIPVIKHLACAVYVFSAEREA